MSSSITYNGDPQTDREKVRHLIGDTDKNAPILTDEEVQFHLELYGNIFKSARSACIAIVAKFSCQVDESVGRVKLNLSQRVDHFRKLAEDLRIQHSATRSFSPFLGGQSKSDKINRELNEDRVVPFFTRKTHDHPQTKIDDHDVNHGHH